MSATLKIAGSFVLADPSSIEWQQIETYGSPGNGSKVRTKFRSAILHFPPLTSAQVAEWLAICDKASNLTATAIYLPRRTDLAYTTNPEVYSVGSAWDVRYAFHLLGSSHNVGPYVYGLQILMQMMREYASGGGG